jgi:uncharacterized protein YuzE
MYAYYDPEANIALFIFTRNHEDDFTLVSDETPWGLIHYDEKTKEPVGIELWGASKRLPAAVLEALPEPKMPEEVPERERAA